MKRNIARLILIISVIAWLFMVMAVLTGITAKANSAPQDDGKISGDDIPATERCYMTEEEVQEDYENENISKALYDSGYFLYDVPLDDETQAFLRAACDESGIPYELALAVVRKESTLRCSNPNDSCWRIYGGKGIKVCNEWMNSFEAFKSWSLENGYSDDLNIDRINSCGNYEPSNCRWATPYQQANNTSRNHVIEWNGEKLTATQWDRRLGFSIGTVSGRIGRGWSLERAMTQPKKQQPHGNQRTERPWHR